MADEHEHPAPWRWVEDHKSGAWFLYDAHPNILMVSPNGREESAPRIRALTEAAPELAEELRKVLGLIDVLSPLALSNPTAVVAVSTREGMSAVLDGARALLAQIEERSRG